jgi:hypothetical protein
MIRRAWHVTPRNVFGNGNLARFGNMAVVPVNNFLSEPKTFAELKFFLAHWDKSMNRPNEQKGKGKANIAHLTQDGDG